MVGPSDGVGLVSPLIGRYELLARIGSGGMGEVFRARAVGAGGFEKEVVIKRILPHLASDPGFVQRFIEEGKLVVKLRHAGIAQVLDMGEQDGVFFIAMEHVDGKDLGELMRIAALAGMTMPVPLVAHLLAQLLDALDYAHRVKDADGHPLGVIHRDVSPSNVMIATTGEVKLLDFGIARATERLQGSTTGAIRGKYAYMSPQQAGGQELDARSDQFSVGVVAWELLAGERPFDGPSDLLTLDRIRFHDPGRLRDKAPSVPEDLAEVVERLLEKDPERRFANADLAAQALRRHMVKSGRLATSRELAAWMEAVLASLPRTLRERSVQGLSVDELLSLSLESDPHRATPSPRPSTVVAGAAVAAPPSNPSPRRARFPRLLVGLNLALVALVLVLVLRTGAEETPAELAPTLGRPGSTNVRASGEAATDGAAVSEDSRSREVSEATGSVAPPAPASASAPGSEVGHALAALGDRVLATPAVLIIRAHPPGAMVLVPGFGNGRAPRTVTARRGTLVSGRVSAPDYEPRTFEARVGETESLTITLKPVPRGKVRFKFFPADGTRVIVDGRPMAPGSNVVSAELPVGTHTLVLETPDGRRIMRTFTIDEGETTSLGTLDVGRGG